MVSALLDFPEPSARLRAIEEDALKNSHLSSVNNHQSLAFKGAVRDQFKRASLSITLNLAEGTGKSSKKDRKRYYEIAMGSTRECQAILTLENLEHSEQYLILDRLTG